MPSTYIHFSESEKEQATAALVDDADVHCMMVGAAGCGKTAYWLYPNLEYACASGMSFLATDTKGDLYRNYGGIAKDCYGYNVAVIDLRNPTKSDGNNLLHLVNKYMDLSKKTSGDVAYRAKAEKYAKIISKTLIYGDGDASAYGQNAFFYDSAEGLMTSIILLIAEFADKKERHIVSVFKLIQELMAPSGVKGKNQFQVLMDRLPSDHKARWFSGAALSTGEQAMASIMSTAMSRLNSFLDSEMEQVLCFDTAIDAERFCAEKSAVFIVMPEENPNSFFMVSLLIQQLYREILAVADEHGGKLPKIAKRHNLRITIMSFESGEAALFEMEDAKDPVDILFMDISMPGKDGMSVTRQLRRKDSTIRFSGELIFLTKSEQHAMPNICPV